jgi:hypothetical protein
MIAWWAASFDPPCLHNPARRFGVLQIYKQIFGPLEKAERALPWRSRRTRRTAIEKLSEMYG